MKFSAGEPKTQTERVLWYMREFGSIDQAQALKDLGVMRLASRITDLRSRGFNVKKTMKKVVNRYGEACNVAEYSLEED